MSITNLAQKKITCIVTLHGIGFQQPPEPARNGKPATDGYADALHNNLRESLNCNELILSDDPNRSNGPIYVQSCCPVDGHSSPCSREAGLARLGRWNDRNLRDIDTTNAPLVEGDASVCHIALVYSNLEERVSQPGAAFIAGAMALVSAAHYAHIAGLTKMAFADIMAMFPQPQTKKASRSQGTSTLRVRKDGGNPRVAQNHHTPPTGAGDGLWTILTQLENDVAAYVCHNEQRERIRSFVMEALLRLASRDDVEGIIINSHSNGTVIALDVIRQLPPFAAAKIKSFVTAGSPLRKYIDLFRWGQQIESENPIQDWYNFWDEKDPVADPLEPSIDWHRGEPIPASCDPKLFLQIHPNTGEYKNIDITDIQVSNIDHSPIGGLQAHNYWDNKDEFVKQLATIVKTAIGNEAEIAA
jgi:hypothetical protein